MNRWLAGALAVVALIVVALGVALGLAGSPADSRSGATTAVALLIGIVAIGIGLWKVHGELESTEGGLSVPWAASDSFASPAPERSDRDPPLSSDDLVGVLEDAGEIARTAGDIDAGIAVIRPALRETLVDALSSSGLSRVEIERSIDEGTWTDDRIAASVLSLSVVEPDRPVGDRLRAWLFPEQAIRERARRAVHEVALAADDALSTAPGQHAPRTVPVLSPRLEELTRGVDGHLERAVDPDVTARGPQPRRAQLEGDGNRGGDDSAASSEEVEGDRTDGANAIETMEMGRLPRYRGAVAAAIVLVVAGMADGSGVLLLGALVPLAFVAYGSLSTVTPPDGLAATRTISPTPTPPGGTVTVSLEVTNTGSRTLSDVRLVDGVPEKLAVLAGSPRAAGVLAPGESLRLEYLLAARRGEYRFDSPQCRLRGLGASTLVTATLSPAGDRRLECRVDADAPPLSKLGTDRVGRMASDRPGEGVAFHSIREYRPGDPADRIDWRQYAKRGELATVSYERQVAATVVLVVDARPSARVVAGPGRPTALELSAYAGTRALTDLLGRGNRVGLAVIGQEGPGSLEWVAPGSGATHRSRLIETLRTAIDRPDDESEEDLASSVPPTVSSIQTSNWSTDPHAGSQSESANDGSGEMGRGGGFDRNRAWVDELIERIGPGTQLALCSPLLDGRPVELVERWLAADVPVVVLSPDVVPENTVSGQYVQTRRRTRLTRCQAAGARTVDWRRGTPLPIVIEYAFQADAKAPANRTATDSSRGDD